MPTTNLPTLVVGDQRRRIVTVETILTDHTPGSETVQMTAEGPDGTAVLTGPLVDVFTLVWRLDARLADLARGEA